MEEDSIIVYERQGDITDMSVIIEINGNIEVFNILAGNGGEGPETLRFIDGQGLDYRSGQSVMESFDNNNWLNALGAGDEQNRQKQIEYAVLQKKQGQEP